MFKKYFNSEIKKTTIKEENISILESKDFDKVLADIRKEVKIKQIIPTRFGIEVILFNKNDAELAAKIANTDKIEGTSIFVNR